MNNTPSFREMSGEDEKQFCFDVLSRCRYIPEFYLKLKELMEATPSPFTEDNVVRELKPEFKNCNC